MKRNALFIATVVGVILSILTAWLAIKNQLCPFSRFLAFTSSILLGLSLLSLIATISDRRRLGEKQVSTTYVSFPFNMPKEKISAVKRVVEQSPVICSDEIVEPGDDYRVSVENALMDVEESFIFITGGDLSARQKYELKELKRNNTRITPVIVGNATVPQEISNYEPLSLDAFLSRYEEKSSQYVKDDVMKTFFESFDSYSSDFILPSSSFPNFYYLNNLKNFKKLKKNLDYYTTFKVFMDNLHDIKTRGRDTDYSRRYTIRYSDLVSNFAKHIDHDLSPSVKANKDMTTIVEMYNRSIVNKQSKDNKNKDNKENKETASFEVVPK